MDARGKGKRSGKKIENKNETFPRCIVASYSFEFIRVQRTVNGHRESKAGEE